MTPPSMVLRRILRLEPKNRTKASVQLERELLIAMQVQGLDPNNTINIALERHLMNLNVNIPASMEPAAPAKVRA